MRKTVFEYIKVLHHNIDGSIVCTDENLQIISCTSEVYDMFGISRELMTDICAILPTSFLPFVRKVVIYQSHGFFSFTADRSKASFQCFITPILFDRQTYLLFLIFRADDCIDPTVIRQWYQQTSRQLSDTASNISSYLLSIKSDRHYNVEPIINHIRMIRKASRHLGILIQNRVLSQPQRNIDLKNYLTRICSIITEKVDSERIRFLLDFSDGCYISKLAYEYLDFVVSNIAVCIAKRSVAPAVLLLSLAETGNSNVITVSSQCKTAEMTADSAVVEALTFRAIQRATELHGGGISVSITPDRKSFAVISIPKTDEVGFELFSPPADDADDLFSNISVELSDII